MSRKGVLYKYYTVAHYYFQYQIIKGLYSAIDEIFGLMDVQQPVDDMFLHKSVHTLQIAYWDEIEALRNTTVIGKSGTKGIARSQIKS